MMFGRFRSRIDALEAHAHETMSSGDEAIALAKTLIALAKALVEDLQDGVTIELQSKDGQWKLPFVLRIDPREEIPEQKE